MKRARKKRCVVCGESFMPQFTTLQKTCSTKCAIDYAKLKEAGKRSQLNEIRNERESIEKLSSVINYTEKVVHDYVRMRDKGKPCVSCGRDWDSSFQAGHRFDKKQYNRIRFDLDNIHGQCPGCNQYNDGNYNAYHLRLPKRIGMVEYQKLEKRAEIALRIPHTYTRYELKEIQKQIKQLRDETKR